MNTPIPTPKPAPKTVPTIKFDEFGWAQDPRVTTQRSPNHSGPLGHGSKYAVMHYTAAGKYSGSVSHFMNPRAQASSHFVIGRNGEIVQMVSILNKAWHAGRSQWNGISGLNSASIGFEFANWGWLTRNTQGQFLNHYGRVYAGEPPVEDLAFGRRYWEPYPLKQTTAGLLILGSINRWKLRRDEIFYDVLGHSDVSPGRKTDPGPAFPMSRFRSMIDDRSFDGGLV